jgi:hypothetical protein
MDIKSLISKIPFIGPIIAFFIKVKETFITMSEDKWIYLVPLILSFFIGLGDYIEFEKYTLIMYIVSAGIYYYMFYRYCELLSKKENKVVDKQKMYIHSTLKTLIVVMSTVIGYSILSLFPIINLIELIPVLGAMALHYVSFIFFYVVVMIFYPQTCF